MKKDDSQYTEEEAQRRFMGALKAALNAPPKPRKMMTPKGVPAQQKKPIEKPKR